MADERHLLIAEADRDVAQGLTRILKPHGYHVIVARSADDARKMAFLASLCNGLPRLDSVVADLGLDGEKPPLDDVAIMMIKRRDRDERR